MRSVSKRRVTRGSNPPGQVRTAVVLQSSTKALEGHTGVVTRTSPDGKYTWLKFPNHPNTVDTPYNWCYRNVEYGPFIRSQISHSVPQKR